MENYEKKQYNKDFCNKDKILKEKRFYKRNKKTLFYVEYYKKNGKLEKVEFFQKDGKTLNQIEYYKKNGKLKKVEFFQEDGKALNQIEYYIANKKIRKVEIFQENGKTLDYAIYRDNNNNIIYAEFKDKKGRIIKHQCDENKLSKNFKKSYIKHQIEISKEKKLIANAKTLEKKLNIKKKKFKIIDLSINSKYFNSMHGISIFCQKDKNGNKTFAIIDSNGYNKTHKCFTLKELTIEKYKEILGVKENDKFIYLENETQKDETCHINTIANIRFIGNLLKEGYKLEDIISCLNKATNNKMAIELKEKNKELYEKVCKFLIECSENGFVLQEIANRIKKKQIKCSKVDFVKDLNLL